MIDQSYARLIIKQFEPLVYQTLHSFHISSRTPDFNDFAQELRIKLIYLAERFDGKPLKISSDRYRFVAYVKLGLKWHLLNLFKKSPRDILFDNDYSLETSPLQIKRDTAIENIKLAEYHRMARTLLKDREYFVYLALVDGLSASQIMSSLDIKKSTFYKMKKDIKKKLQPLYKKLKENID